MRVLIVTKIFPNRVEPLSSPFNRRQFSELSSLCEVEVLATIPWFPGIGRVARWSRAARLTSVPRSDCIEGLTVRHPRFVFVPRIAPSLSGPLYAASLASTVLRYRGRVDVVLGSWAYPDGFAAVVLAEMLAVPAVIKLHGSDMNVVARMPGPRRWLRWALPRTARVVAVSEPLRKAAIALGAPAAQVDVVPNGIDRARFQPRDRAEARVRCGLPGAADLLLYVGNLEVHKGVLDLIRAFAKVRAARPSAALVIVGDGAARSDCERLAAEVGGAITFIGAKPHAEIPDWLAACDVFVLPSWNEGTPNVVLEALASGRRVVATRVGGTPDVLEEGVGGALVPPRDPDALARALGEALGVQYDPAAVAATLGAPDWSGSARALHASLLAAVETGSRKAA